MLLRSICSTPCRDTAVTLGLSDQSKDAPNPLTYMNPASISQLQSEQFIVKSLFPSG